ncbi:hypothetical protein ACHAWF_008341 [Thalassiosira exigua]
MKIWFASDGIDGFVEPQQRYHDGGGGLIVDWVMGVPRGGGIGTIDDDAVVERYYAHQQDSNKVITKIDDGETKMGGDIIPTAKRDDDNAAVKKKDRVQQGPEGRVIATQEQESRGTNMENNNTATSQEDHRKTNLNASAAAPFLLPRTEEDNVTTRDSSPCQADDPVIEEKYPGFPQTLSFGAFREEKGQPFITQDFWADTVDNKRTFFLCPGEVGEPSLEDLYDWIKTRPHPITLVINNQRDKPWPDDLGNLDDAYPSFSMKQIFSKSLLAMQESCFNIPNCNHYQWS